MQLGFLSFLLCFGTMHLNMGILAFSSLYGLRLFESTEKPEILECIELSLKCNEADDDFKGEVDAKEIFTHDDGRMGVEQDRLLDLNELHVYMATTTTVLPRWRFARGYGEVYPSF